MPNTEKAAAQPVEQFVTVTVKSPLQVRHEGTNYGPGEQVTVTPSVAAQWALYGWTED